ncbi:hypothetical protein [Zhihengliuella flava]|uniref:Secreted protein n=1 Tax=Zhihengliuella flava TaxID=1285193 RepID=A0A931DCG3_9MICC|nr:hypothetical protein [Zhihengliuella flava]MBG6084323.1 hypothetical protein [Zhihengliuella flava]
MRRLTALALTAAAALSLTACAQVQQAAEDAANSAASTLTDAAKREALTRACAPITDGTLNADDVAVLTSLLEPAEAAGVPADLLSPLRELADAGDAAPQAAIDRAAEACETALAE